MIEKTVQTAALYRCEVPYLTDFFASHRYPWEMLPDIRALAEALLRDPPAGFSRLGGELLVGEHVSIHESAVIEGPAILGDGCVLRPGAYLRGNVIAGRGCVIGNSTELKNVILLDHVQLPHYNYVGDSIVGNRAHMGAGAVCSNLKADGRPVVIHGEVSYETGLRKCGALLGDEADVGCGCVLNPGTVIGPRTRVYPLCAVRGVIPADRIVKSAAVVVERKENDPCAESSDTLA